MSYYLDRVNGVNQQQTPISTSTGASDASKIVQTDAGGKLDVSLMPTGVKPNVKVVQAIETLTAGDFVNIYYDGSATAYRARKADGSTTGKEANGFVLAGVAAAADATVYTEGTNNQVSGLDTNSGQVWLSHTTAGDFTTTAPAPGSGGISQSLGTIVSDTEIEFEPELPPTELA